jgi:hypothetical protein
MGVNLSVCPREISEKLKYHFIISLPPPPPKKKKILIFHCSNIEKPGGEDKSI